MVCRCRPRGQKGKLVAEIVQGLRVFRDARQVAAGVNGPLLEMLAEAAEWHDKAAIELFRTGAPLFGLLEKSGVGVEVPVADDADPGKILHNMEDRNSKVCVS